MPPHSPAMATAASLPDASMSPYSVSRRESVSPAFRYMDEPSTAAYSGFTVYTRSRSPSPSATSAVMILVVDAIGRRLSAFCSNSVSPVSASITTAPRALTAPALGRTSKSASTQNSFFTLHHSPHNKTYSAFTRVGFAGKRGFIRRRTGFPPLRLRPRSCP